MTPFAMYIFALLSDVLVTAIWTSAVLAVCVMLALRAMPELPARLRSSLWMVTFGVALVLPAVMVLRPHAERMASFSQVHVGIAWALPLSAVWIAFSMYRIGGLVFASLHLREVVGRAVEPSWPSEIAMWLAAHRTLRSVQLRVSHEVDRPSVVGYVRPVILLPAGLLSELRDGDLQRILLHEAQHVRRLDDCVNLLQKIGVALFPFSPALLWMECRLCLERELACDDAVLESTGAPKAYAVCLTQMAENRLRSRVAVLAVAAFGRQPELSRRVFRILQWPPRQASRFVYGLSSAMLLAGLVTGTAGLERFGLPVAFDSAPLGVAYLDARVTLAPIAGPAMHMAIQEAGSPQMTQASYRSPETCATLHKGTRLNSSVAKVGHQVHSSPQIIRTETALPAERGTVAQVPVERLIEYAPDMREQTPVLQEISIPYAVIPAGNGWLIVQL